MQTNSQRHREHVTWLVTTLETIGIKIQCDHRHIKALVAMSADPENLMENDTERAKE